MSMQSTINIINMLVCRNSDNGTAALMGDPKYARAGGPAVLTSPQFVVSESLLCVLLSHAGCIAAGVG